MHNIDTNFNLISLRRIIKNFLLKSGLYPLYSFIINVINIAFSNPFSKDKLVWELLPLDKQILECIDNNHIYSIWKKHSKKQNFLGDFYYEIGMYCNSIGLQDLATKIFEISLQFKFSNDTAMMYLTNFMLNSPDVYDHEYVYQVTKRTIKKLSEISEHDELLVKYPLPQIQKNKKILNIGYTCHFFDNSTGTTLFLPILKNHNKDKFKIFVYSDQHPSITKPSTKLLADVWHDTHKLNTVDFCNLVRSDEIDIFIELNGFCVKNRFKEVSLRCAPKQVSFYNLSATSGADNLDYVIISEDFDIKKIKEYYSEEILVKKGSQNSTALNTNFSPVKSELPLKRNGYITFGSFGQIHKVTRAQIFLWAEIMKKVPNSKFLLKSNNLDHPTYLKAFKKHFADAGISSDRVIFEGYSGYNILLSRYENIDIALDTYPYAAGTTTMEALLQGTPVISLVGERICSQHGKVSINKINEDSLLSYSKEEYIEKAVALANDPEKLENYRLTLREKMLASPLSDIKTYTQELESAFTEIYNK
ncbi:MAG: hypothetical protein BGO27_04385 [Alphaproteobacteria bacterium 33-17]|nr:MAG: hypothetical protein BGO27_04385 [Alphaproteobacteria bacterium 33-17]